MWLLPPQADQSSAIALLLRTEIQSHNTTREMLHATEQRRLEAFQRCDRLQSDIRAWMAAYNGLGDALCKCSQEYSRLLAENAALRAHTHSEPATDSNATAPQMRQIETLWKKLFRLTGQSAEVAMSLDADADLGNDMAPLFVACDEVETSLYS
jgi:hypothetical protein